MGGSVVTSSPPSLLEPESHAESATIKRTKLLKLIARYQATAMPRDFPKESIVPLGS
jgi:hypothetical protein